MRSFTHNSIDINVWGSESGNRLKKTHLQKLFSATGFVKKIQISLFNATTYSTLSPKALNVLGVPVNLKHRCVLQYLCINETVPIGGESVAKLDVQLTADRQTRDICIFLE